MKKNRTYGTDAADRIQKLAELEQQERELERHRHEYRNSWGDFYNERDRIQKAIQKAKEVLEEEQAREHFQRFYSAPSSENSPYAHFCLLLLALYQGNKKRLIDTLVQYTICHLASKIMKEDAELFRELGETTNHQMTKPLPSGFDKRKKSHRAVGTAMRRLGLVDGDIQSIGSARRECKEFLEHWREAGQPYVRIPMATMSEFRDRKDLLERDFRVLCAVNSSIGNKSYAIINNWDLGRRAVGAKNQATLEQLDLEPLSRWQVRSSLEKLQRLGFFHRALLGRKTFICRSTAMSPKELAAIAKARKKEQMEAGKPMIVS